MSLRRWKGRNVAVAAACLTAMTAVAPAAGAAASAGPSGTAAKATGPALKLMVAQRSITVDSFRGRVFLDPGIWLASLGSPLVLDVQRASYAKPITLTQVIHPPFGGTVRRPLPASLLDGFRGLAKFGTLTVTNSAGQVVSAKPFEFCPNGFQTARVAPGSPPVSPYPTECGFNPFTVAMVWGIQKGWAADPAAFEGKLPNGVYHVTETISPVYARLFHISAADATATVKVTVVKGQGCCGRGAPGHARRTAHPPAVPALSSPPKAALPDLVALPSWGIRVSHPKKQTHDFLTFGATVSIGGNSPLDVEGFRHDSAPMMRAYQYFWQNGKVIGRARTGTMGFDNLHGHNHWHFEQFAKYALLNSAKSLVTPSHKVGFCIAPVDPIDLLIPHAAWQASFPGSFGNCGTPSALWVSEELPLGWSDTYNQEVAGQAFDITSVPNGTYYIQITANPDKLLYETTASNDVSLRKVILGGTPGHRTVTVPAFDGIDPEP